MKKLLNSIIFPIWKWLLIGYGLLAFLRDEFVPEQITNKLRIIKMIDIINWYWWVIIGLVFWAIVTVIYYQKTINNMIKKYEEAKLGHEGKIRQLSEKYMDRKDKLKNEINILREENIRLNGKINNESNPS